MLRLPIAHREMLVQTRSNALHRERVKSSIVLLLLGIGFWLFYEYGPLSGLRLSVQMLGYGMVMMCVFGGVSVTADTIAREKREGTLGLLFLTALSPFEIVAGKLMAAGLALLYGVIMALPFFSIAIVAGGIGGREMLWIFLVAVNALFVSAAIGVYASAVSQERRKAHGRGIWLVLFFWWMVPGAADLVSRSIGNGRLVEILRLFSVGINLGPAPGPGLMGRGVAPGPLNLLCTHLIGWFFLAAATFYVQRYWQEHPPKLRFNLREWWSRISHGNTAQRARLRRKFLDRNPYRWMTSRDRSRRWTAWAATLLATGVLSLLLPETMPKEAKLAVITGICAAMVLFSWAGSAVSHLLAEHEQGTMELLLCTPMTPRQIMRGQLRGLLRQFGGPILLLLVFCAVFMGWQMLEPVSAGLKVMRGFYVVLVAALYLFTLFTLHHLGLWTVMTVRDPKQHAGGTALAQAFLVPLLVCITLMAMLGFLRWSGAPVGDLSMTQFLSVWIALQLGSNAFWIVVVRRGIDGKMREWAMKRYTPEPAKKSWLERLLPRRAAPQT